MKKIKTINKLLSSLTLLSPLAGIGFNNQYQNTQNVITENYNNSLNNYFSSNEQRTMGDIIVTVEGTTITEFVSSSGEGKLIIDSDITEIAQQVFRQNSNITSLNLSQATSLTTIGDFAFYDCRNLTGDITIPSNVTSIGSYAFFETRITSLDLSNATSLTSIGDSAFAGCKSLTGDLIIPSSVTTIGNNAFIDTNITSLDLSQATSLTAINLRAFESCSNLTGDLVIPSSVTSIDNQAFANVTLDNLYFLSETQPSFGADWQPTVTGKIYVPSEAAKQAYLGAPNFGFNAEQIDIGLPPESKSNIGLILGLVFGLGIPILAAVGFAIGYLTKKKKTTVKI